MKLAPLFYLQFQKIAIFENIVFSVLFFATYLLYMIIIKESIIDVYSNMTNSIIYDKNNTTLEYLLHKIK